MQQPPNYPNGQPLPPNNQPGFYHQPTSQYRQPGPNQQLPPLPHTRLLAWLRRPSRSRLIVLGILLPVCILTCCIATGVSALSGSQQTQTPTRTPTSQQVTPTDTPTKDTSLLGLTPTNTPADYPTDTPIPTDTPTPPPTQSTGGLLATHGTPRLGGPVSDFVGKYGPPDTGCATCASGVYNFQRYQGTQLDYISTMLTDANGHTNAFDVSAPPNSNWDVSTAAALCASFGPSDVNYSHPIQVLSSSDGSTVEKVYKSAWLAGQLAKGDFQDLNTMSGNTDLPPGTFDIDYTYPSGPSSVSDCSLEAGIQRV